MTKDDVITIEKYIDTCVNGVEGRMDARVNAMERAVDTAYRAMEKRLDGMNEFRQTLNDASKTYASKESLDTLRGDIHKIEISDATLAGKASQTSVMISWVVGFSGLALGIISLVATLIGD